MESPVVVDKPPEYHGNAPSNNERGFPFDEEEGTGAWSELAARHPDIAVRLRQRPATWARKRRPSSQDAADDFGESFSGFDRFPFDDIPPEFREHFPSHWNRRFGSREEPHPQPSSPQPQPQSPSQQTIATQTEEEPVPSQDEQTSIPNYGLRNTVDLGQKSAADPSLSEAEDRNQRSMSAPPDNRTAKQNNTSKMSGHQEQQHQPQQEFQSSNVRHIPIFVEGRDEPVINKTVDHGTHFGESKPTYVPPPPTQPHVDREQYFADEVPHGFHHPPNFSRTFGTPFANKGFRQGPQPFVQQKVYPQTAFARGASPQRSQSPKPQMYPEEHFVKVPVHHEQTSPRAETPSRPQPKQQSPRQQTPPQQPPPPKQPTPPPKQPTPPPQPKPQPSANDPITQILSIQTDVLNLMTEVENFKGTKKDKKYIYLDEMLTRNLIKLDNIETDGKENIRLARKEAIKCIQKCIAVLEAKADNKGVATPQQTQDVEMESTEEKQVADEAAVENGEVEMKEPTKEEQTEVSEGGEAQQQNQIKAEVQPEHDPVKMQEEVKEEQKPVEEKKEESQAPTEKTEMTQPELEDTRPVETMTSEPQADMKSEEQKSQEKAEKKSPKKGTKTVKKRDKSKDKKELKEQDSNKEENVDKKEEKIEAMIVDGKGDKTDSQTMEVDGAASQ